MRARRPRGCRSTCPTRARDAVDLDDHRRLSERVLTAGDRVDAELPQPGIDAGGGVDRVEDRVDRAVTVLAAELGSI